MKKTIVILLAGILLCSCKKEEDVKPDDSKDAQSITIHTYLGYEGNKTAYDTTVNGSFYSTYNYSIPEVYYELDNSEVVLYKDGAVVVSGSTDNKGEFVFSGLKTDNGYTFKVRSKTFTDGSATYHYSLESKLNTKNSDILNYYNIPFGSGIGYTSGAGSTQTAIDNPWYD